MQNPGACEPVTEEELVKNIMLIMVSAILGALSLAIVMTISGRENRSMELQSGLSSVTEETVANLRGSIYDIKSTEEYTADFLENLSIQMDADSDPAVRVMKADKEKCLLAVQVTETFEHPNGNRGNVEHERTVILNQTEKPAPEAYRITFYTDAECYKSYLVYEGDLAAVPAGPQKAGAAFAGWKDINGYMADFSLPVEQDMDFFAEWE